MKGWLSGLGLLLMVGLVAGGTRGTKDGQEKKNVAAVSIGVSKIVSHPGLDDIEKGLQETVLAENPEVVFDLQNAQNEVNNAVTIAQRFRNRKVTLAVGIATPAAVALVNHLGKEVPVVFSGVTDPVAAGLVDSWNGGSRVTGLSDLSPVEEQFRYIRDLTHAQVVGIIYNAGETNSQVLADLAEKAATKLGMQLVRSAVVNSSELSQATLVLVKKVQAIYLPTDNTVYAGIAAINDVALLHKIPIIGADISGSRGTQTLMALGVNYYKMGLATGKVINQILAGTDPASIPIQVPGSSSAADLWLNLDAAKTLGIQLPAELVSRATYLVENGVERAAP